MVILLNMNFLKNYIFVLFFRRCLFVWGLSSHSRIFHSYVDVTITDEGLQTYAQHSRPLNSEGSLACQTTLTRVIRLPWSSPRTYDTSTYYRAFSSGALTTTKVCRAEIWTPTFRLRCERSNPIRHRGVFNIHWGIHISGHLYFSMRSSIVKHALIIMLRPSTTRL